MSTEKVLKFPYTKVPVTDIYGKEIGEAYRPIVSLTLFYGAKKFNVLGLVDTGADECLFPGEFARLLGHDLTKGKPRTFAGIGGAITGYLHQQNIFESEANEKRELFKKCVEICQTVFGNVAYKRVFPGNDELPSGYIDKSLNQGIFDMHMCGFMEYGKRDVIPRAQAIKEAFLELVTSNDKFIETIEIGTYGTPQVKLRMEMWVGKLREVMGMPKDDRRLFTFEEKQRLFDQDKTCALCGNKIAYIEDAHVDHIERYSEGGKTSLSNARLAHRYCNLSRH